MDTQYHTLPPRKRLSLRQKQRNNFDYNLPTKKRSQSKRTKTTAVPEAVTYPLPTKKRIRAFQLESVDYSILCDDGGDYRLPAKKRMDSRVVVRDMDAGMVSLQNRKRVCAFKPDFVFDLNVEHKPYLEDDFKLESAFGNVVIKSREVKEESMMNVGYSFDNKIKIGSNCADLQVAGEFGSSGGEVTESEINEVVDELGRDEKRLVDGVRFEIGNNFDTVEINVKESSKVAEEMENADETDRCEVNIIEENHTTEFFGSDGDRDACVDTAFDGNGGHSLSSNSKELGNYDVFEEAGISSCDEEVVKSVDLKNADKFNGVLEICCNEVERDACVVEGAADGKVLEFAASNEADVANEANGVVEGCCNESVRYACVDSVNDDTLTRTNIHGGDILESEVQHLELVTSTDAANEGDSESEDGVVCEICQSTDGEPSNPIVFCDGCDLMVHASCYGNPLVKEIPEGDWFCDKCISQTKSPINPISCCLCPSSKGVLKPTTDGRWAHIVCAVFVPEAFFLDPEGREGIDVSNISVKRWNKRCYICKKSKCCAIDCSESKCSLSFHVTCGLKEDLCIEYKEGNSKKGGIVAGFCHDHTKLWKKQQQTGKFKIVARKSDDL